jgi:glycosyltransferase involved in cell wall biosynthesis
MNSTAAPSSYRADPPHVGPLRVLVLRGVDGTGGGADKIILRNAAGVDPERVHMTLAFMRRRDDPEYDLDRRCAALELDYREIFHCGATDRRVLPQLLDLARQVRPHLIHSHDYKANFYAMWLARRAGILRLSTAHGWTGNGWRERALYYPADKLILSRFPGVIAVSEPIRRTLVRWGAEPARVRVLLNGVDPQAYCRDEALRQRMRRQLGYEAKHVVLGAVGRVERQKRFDVLMQAMSRLAAARTDLRLVVAGEGSLLEPLRRQVDRLGLTDRVQLLGHCPNMREIYQAFDLLVQSSDYEGTPTVVVEALALQIPVVATDVGGTRQLIAHGQHGLLVARRRPDLLAQAILDSLHDRAATAQRVAAGRQRVETELNYQRRLEALQQIYLELVSHGSLDVTGRPGRRLAGWTEPGSG